MATFQYTIYILFTSTDWCLNRGNRSRRTNLCHFFREAFFSAHEKRMPLNGYREARGRLPVIKRERVESRRVVLSGGLCLES